MLSLADVAASYRIHGANRYEPRTADRSTSSTCARRVVYAAATTARIERLAAELGLDRPYARILSVSDLANRLVSLKLAPDPHPFAPTATRRLALDGARAASRRFDVSLPMKLIYVGWFTVMAAAPRPLSRRLAELLLFRQRRGGLNRVLGRFTVERGPGRERGLRAAGAKLLRRRQPQRLTGAGVPPATEGRILRSVEELVGAAAEPGGRPDGRERQTIRLQPTRGFGRVSSAKDLWHYRDVGVQIAARDVKVRYRQTALGAAWAVLQPLATMVVFSLFFGRIAGLSSDGVPYPVFSLAALVPWTFFATALLLGADSMVSNSVLVSKIYFPRIFIPAGVIAAGLVDLGISLVFSSSSSWRGAPSAAVLAYRS